MTNIYDIPFTRERDRFIKEYNEVYLCIVGNSDTKLDDGIYYYINVMNSSYRLTFNILK